MKRKYLVHKSSMKSIIDTTYELMHTGEFGHSKWTLKN